MASQTQLALNLTSFQFTYRTSYIDWRLLHGIDVDTVIRLTDVAAVEDCLDTLQHGAWEPEAGRVCAANAVQLFRLLQLALEYTAHLRAAHAGLLERYGEATAAAEGWKLCARAYLDAGGALAAEGAGGGHGAGAGMQLSRGAVEAADGARGALEAADRAYNAALDALEAEDARARHFRFRRQRQDMAWAALHAADVGAIEASRDTHTLERLLPALTYGGLHAEDERELTPHHFAQLVPLGQAALDWLLWQANATGAMLEQAMATLQAICADIPLITTATQDLHAHLTALMLEAQQGGPPGAMAPHGAGHVGPSPLGPGGPWASGSVDLGQGQWGLGRPGSVTPAGMPRPLSPALLRPGSMGGPGGGAQVLRLGSAGGMGVMGAMGGGPRASRLGSAGSRQRSPRSSPDTLEALLAAAAAGGGGLGAPSGPVLELHTKAAELAFAVEAIEHDLRLERGKTEEMRRILADIRARLNTQRPSAAAPSPGHRRRGSAGGPSLAASLTFPSASAHWAHLLSGAGPHSVPGSPRRGARGAGAGLASPREQGTGTPPHTPAKVRVIVDEGAIRQQEQQRALDLMAAQGERLKEQAMREHRERRLGASGSGAGATGYGGVPPLPLHHTASAGALTGLGRLQQEASLGGRGGSRGVSREPSRSSLRAGARAPGRREGSRLGYAASSGEGEGSERVSPAGPDPALRAPHPRAALPAAFGSVSLAGPAAAEAGGYGGGVVSKASSFSELRTHGPVSQPRGSVELARGPWAGGAGGMGAGWDGAGAVSGVVPRLGLSQRY